MEVSIAALCKTIFQMEMVCSRTKMVLFTKVNGVRETYKMAHALIQILVKSILANLRKTKSMAEESCIEIQLKYILVIFRMAKL